MKARLDLIGAAIGQAAEAGKIDAVRADHLLALWRRAHDEDGSPEQFVSAAAGLGLMARARPASYVEH